MGASLEVHGKDSKAAVSNIPAREPVSSSDNGREVCGTLSYTDAENRIINGENNLDTMRRMAYELIDAKPFPAFYVWGGPSKGWLDREAAKTMGL